MSTGLISQGAYSLGGFCPRGLMSGGAFGRGLMSGGFCLGGFCPRTIKIVSHQTCLFVFQNIFYCTAWYNIPCLLTSAMYSKWCLLIPIYRCDWNGLDVGIACLVICTLSQHSCGMTTVQWVSLAHHYKPNC